MCAVDVRMDIDTDRDRRPWHKWKLSPAPQGDVFIPKNKSWLCSLQRFLLGYVCGMWDGFLVNSFSYDFTLFFSVTYDLNVTIVMLARKHIERQSLTWSQNRFL